MLAIYLHLQQTLICCTACLKAPSIFGCSIDISACSTIVSNINRPAEPLDRMGVSSVRPSRPDICSSVDKYQVKKHNAQQMSIDRNSKVRRYTPANPLPKRKCLP